jgi:hypothetical protein
MSQTDKITQLSEVDSRYLHELFTDKSTWIKHLVKGKCVIESLRFTDDFEFPAPNGKEDYNLLFINCVFAGNVNFYSKKAVYQNIVFESCHFEKDLIVTAGTFGDFHVKGGIIDSALEVSGGTFNSFNFYANVRHLHILGGKIKTLNIRGRVYKKDYPIGNLTLGMNDVDAYINIERIKVNDFHLSQTLSKDTEILVSDMQVSSLYVSDFLNNGRVRLFRTVLVPNIENFSRVEIENCNLGKFDFCDLDLRNVNLINFAGSFLIDCTFINVAWPKRLYLDGVNKTRYMNMTGLRETYRQLKYAYYKQGDTVMEHQFHALEMKVYAIRLLREGEWCTRKGMQTFLILLLSWGTSDFGQSIIRPLLTLLFLGVLLFTLFVYQGGAAHLQIGNFNWSTAWGTFPDVVNFMNPLRRPSGDLKEWPIVTDVLMRIISSYCIFNIVRATRRFVK